MFVSPKKIKPQEAMDEVLKDIEVSPTFAGLPVTTPKRSRCPRRTGVLESMSPVEYTSPEAAVSPGRKKVLMKEQLGFSPTDEDLDEYGLPKFREPKPKTPPLGVIPLPPPPFRTHTAESLAAAAEAQYAALMDTPPKPAQPAAPIQEVYETTEEQVVVDGAQQTEIVTTSVEEIVTTKAEGPPESSPPLLMYEDSYGIEDMPDEYYQTALSFSPPPSPSPLPQPSPPTPQHSPVDDIDFNIEDITETEHVEMTEIEERLEEDDDFLNAMIQAHEIPEEFKDPTRPTYASQLIIGKTKAKRYAMPRKSAGPQAYLPIQEEEEEISETPQKLSPMAKHQERLRHVKKQLFTDETGPSDQVIITEETVEEIVEEAAPPPPRHSPEFILKDWSPPIKGGTAGVNLEEGFEPQGIDYLEDMETSPLRRPELKAPTPPTPPGTPPFRTPRGDFSILDVCPAKLRTAQRYQPIPSEEVPSPFLSYTPPPTLPQKIDRRKYTTGWQRPQVPVVTITAATPQRTSHGVGTMDSSAEVFEGAEEGSPFDEGFVIMEEEESVVSIFPEGDDGIYESPTTERVPSPYLSYTPPGVPPELYESPTTERVPSPYLSYTPPGSPGGVDIGLMKKLGKHEYSVGWQRYDRPYTNYIVRAGEKRHFHMGQQLPELTLDVIEESPQGNNKIIKLLSTITVSFTAIEAPQPERPSSPFWSPLSPGRLTAQEMVLLQTSH